MDRRSFLLRAGGAAALASTMGLHASAEKGDGENAGMSKPNIIFILTDDQGAWAMGCAGNPEIRSPNLDRLAAEGTRFENFFLHFARLLAGPRIHPHRPDTFAARRA